MKFPNFVWTRTGAEYDLNFGRKSFLQNFEIDLWVPRYNLFSQLIIANYR